MTIFQKKYLDSYNDSFSRIDPKTQEHVRNKEDIICQSPYSNSLLKHGLQGIRRYKNKLRILYAITGELDCPLIDKIDHPAVYFLFVDVRRDDTYKDAYKLLQSTGVL